VREMPEGRLDIQYDTVVVGAGYSGVSAALRLAKKGFRVLILEEEENIGGLAGSFEFEDGVTLEKFYHHWFGSDEYVFELLQQLGLIHMVRWAKSRTGSFLNKRIWKLSTPRDLLQFTELSLTERVRLGLVVIYVRLIRDFRKIEDKSIKDWLVPLVGNRVFEVVWEPLVRAKFGRYSEDISAAWMWKKLVLRGGSRKANGSENLAYFEGGFSSLNGLLLNALRENGVDVLLDQRVESFLTDGFGVKGVRTVESEFAAKSVILAIPQPLAARMLNSSDPKNTVTRVVPEIPHLANICLVMRLSHSLSDTYWLNVSDPGFPFVGIVQHSNLDTSDAYGGSHIVYLSRYLEASDSAWGLDDDSYYEYCLPFIKQMFPMFSTSWVVGWRIWRARFAQPVTLRGYSRLVPGFTTQHDNVFQCSMAQIFPEDRGTNYAVRGGAKVASVVEAYLLAEHEERA